MTSRPADRQATAARSGSGADVSLRHQPKIAVVCGGPSAEAEVSRVSGRGVAEALHASYSNVHIVELDGGIAEIILAQQFDVVFPVLHGPQGEDGTFQGFLETLGVPYVGSGVRASACAMDKILAKHLFRAAGLPVARDTIVDGQAGIHVEAGRVMETLGLGVVVKPAGQGSALGVRFPTTRAELEGALEEALTYDGRVLVEERIHGREITVAIIERAAAEALPVIEITTPRGTWYDFAHRYTAGLSEHIVPALLPETQYKRAQELARLAHIALGCRDLSRVDFVVPSEGDPIVLEVNTLPGMTPTSLYPDAAKAAGISFEALVALLIQRALARSEKRGNATLRDC